MEFSLSPCANIHRSEQGSVSPSFRNLSSLLSQTHKHTHEHTHTHTYSRACTLTPLSSGTTYKCERSSFKLEMVGFFLYFWHSTRLSLSEEAAERLAEMIWHWSETMRLLDRDHMNMHDTDYFPWLKTTLIFKWEHTRWLDEYCKGPACEDVCLLRQIFFLKRFTMQPGISMV